MPIRARTSTVGLVAAAVIPPFVMITSCAQAVTFDQLQGWWKTSATHNNQTTELYLHFVERDGKPKMLFSIPTNNHWDLDIGTVKTDGDQVNLEEMDFPLDYDAKDGALIGQLPEGAAPVYKIDVRFTRCEPPVIPPRPEWDCPKPTQKWVHQTGSAIWAGLSHDRDTGLLIAATEGGDVVALRDSDGEPAWSVKLGGGVRAQPTLTAGHAYVTCDDGHLYKLDKSTGREAWRTRIDAGSPPRLEPPDPNTRFDRYASSAVVDGSRVFVGSRDGHLYAIDAESGSEAWRFKSGDMILGTPAVHGDQVLFGSFDNHVYSLAASDGALKWKRDVRGAVPGDVVPADDLVLVGTRAYDLIALNVQTGEPVWTYYYWFSWVESPPAVIDGVAYVGSSDALKVFAFDVKTGRLLWEERIPGWPWARPTVGEDALIIGAAGARDIPTLHGGVFAMDRSTGKILWAFMQPFEQGTRRGFPGAPVEVNGVVYAADLRGDIHAFTAPE